MTTDSKHPHSMLQRELVVKLRMLQKSTVFISNLPETIFDARILSSYFGKFGDIVDISLSSSAYNCYWAKIKYDNPQSAMKAINFVNNVFADTLCKATYGYRKYCRFWLNNSCTEPNCNYLHSWCDINELNNVVTPTMLKRFASFGINNKFGLTSTQLQTNGTLTDLNQCKQQNKYIASPENNQMQQQQMNELIMQIQQTQHSLSNVLQSYNTLKLKYKRLEIKYCDLENKYNDIVSCTDKETNINYISWDSADIYDWIMTINNRHFQKYKDLSMNLLHEEIDGECLSQLDRNDLHRLGIKTFNDKILLLDSIVNLVNNCNGNVNI